MPARLPRSRPEPPEPARRFASQLRDLHREAGCPTQQWLAAQMNCAHSTVSAYLSGQRLPSWESTQAFVRACGGDIRQWRPLWIDARRALDVESARSGSGASTSSDDDARPVALAPATLYTEGISGLQPALYLDNEQFYSTAAAQLPLTRRSIMLTYLRRRPPEYYSSAAAAEYFAAVLAWAREPGARSARRVICAPNPEMRNWAQKHYEETREIKNYEARVIPWDVDADAVNIALFDDSAVFLAFSGEASFQDLSGLRLEGAEALRGFSSYFNQLWHSRNGRTLEEFVEDLNR